MDGTRCHICRSNLPLELSKSCSFVTCPHSPVSMQFANIEKMSGKQFEMFVRDRLIDRGYKSVETTPDSGDMGADLVIRQNGRMIVIQCKRLCTAVGVSAVQEIHAAKTFYGADEAWVITNLSFTRAARKLATSAGVRLKTVLATSFKRA